MKNNRTVSSRAKRISCLFGDGRREGRRGFEFMAFRGHARRKPGNNEFLDN